MDFMKYGYLKRKDVHLKKHNKLVRDKIPEIISQDGKIVVSHILSEKDYLTEEQSNN